MPHAALAHQICFATLHATSSTRAGLIPPWPTTLRSLRLPASPATHPQPLLPKGKRRRRKPPSPLSPRLRYRLSHRSARLAENRALQLLPPEPDCSMTSASASVSHAASSPPLSHQQLAASTKASAAAASTSAVAAAVPAQSRLSVSSASRPRSSAAFASPTATFPAASAPASASASASASTRRSSPSRTVTLAAAPVVAPTGRSSLPLSPSATNRSRSDLTLRSDATDATDAAASPAAVATTTPTAITPSSLSQKRLLPASSPTVAATAPRPALLPSTQTNAQTTSATESNADMPTLTPVAPAKRGRGRPRKRDTAAAGQPGVEPAVKRGPGRPRKIPIEPVAQDLKPAAMLEVTPVKRGPGRPRKVVEPSQVVIKASPPLSASTAAPVAVPDAVPVKRGPGRPRKIVPTVQPAPSTAKIAGVPAPKPSLMDKGKERMRPSNPASALVDFLEHPDDHTFNSLVKSLHHLELDTTIILTLLKHPVSQTRLILTASRR
ncbi:hypothetical protein BC831DRAFT_516049 [Entophlyctis helioformis]|nr:hypothetical protein BC831DRAFT_516049 [Entophlyctis helioformis]